jgi:hypothetical protein
LRNIRTVDHKKDIPCLHPIPKMSPDFDDSPLQRRRDARVPIFAVGNLARERQPLVGGAEFDDGSFYAGLSFNRSRSRLGSRRRGRIQSWRLFAATAGRQKQKGYAQRDA